MNRVSFVSLFLGAVCGLAACSSDKAEGGGGAPGGSGATATAGSSTGGGGTAGSTATQGGSAAIGGSAVAGSSGTSSNAPQGGSSGGTSTGGSAGSGGGSGVEFPPIEECVGTPSVDRLTQWIASGEGSTQPASGSILVKEGEEYIAKVHFLEGSSWAVVPIYIANKYGSTADLSTSRGLSVTYSATAELHVQLRTFSHWSGGAQYATTLPSTAGQKQTLFISFGAENWASLFDPPALSWADSLKEAMGFVLVGPPGDNEITVYGLRIDGWTPPCQ